ncbi:DUF4142 domain-containing protein [Streptomyces sp. NPDC001902]|nr:DUF4142 domain-containing protein [Streptomyces sp. PA03-1a]MDX2815530.1 DUF4142 domain-containing protein [Streptomyces sp. PA03-5A]
MRTRLLAAAVAAAALSGIATPQAFAAGLTDQDTTFLAKVHQGNLAEIAAGNDAQSHATSECVKQVGEVLVQDHSKLDADVKMLAGKLKVTLPASPSSAQDKGLAEVQAKAGSPAYDAAWLSTEDVGHRETLALIDREIKAGSNAEVVAAARSARPVVAMHLEMVRGGTCHAPSGTGMVHAGSGGQFAAAQGSATTAGMVGVAGGALLTAGGAAWLLRIRRRTAGKS